ncbi:phosphate ABC transporter substrate-binding protein PstS [Herbiconiux sp. VKM Ac-2851]|uniref:phosphate ABC transporter substrate-binding protein PstS n=1 Tax=Herbiconiux sp. VKM Ac-2851 TaxID=2739025 RepID=UPI001566150F|nr:phosphate ABC transporter substrate-binding protein PstS [Herbiconiux sp. VKM Ac-2851]NQX36542.1 phosphate ABC transporter substrate-binding protein PstS [Herbiconiux sp. VKM Ac-2851]
MHRFARLRSAALAAAAVVALLAGIGADARPAAADAYLPVSGTGSTWSQNALDQWRKNVANNYGMTINYSGTGSSAGRRDFLQGTVDFAVSEIPFQVAPEDQSAPEVPTRGYAYMPIVAGGTSFMYNLTISGKRVTNLRLSGGVITKIFTGVITNWNDAEIQADNPGLAMPDKPIVPVVRSDGSGSTAQFTLWMAKQHQDLWGPYCESVGRANPCGLTSQYPASGNMKAQNGSLGVAGYVSQDYGEGAITYVEYSYALKSGFPVAKVLNSAGYYIEPKDTSVAVALLSAQIEADLTQNLDGVYNSPDPRTYPLSSYSYMIVPTEVGGIFTAEKGKTLGDFASYFLCEGQQQAGQLGYSPLPMNLVQAGFDQIKKIPGAAGANVDPATCNNPTANNALTDGALQPAPCDKFGSGNQCTTGTAGAVGETPVSGTGGGGTSSDAAVPGTAAAPGGGAAADAAAAGGAAAGAAGAGAAPVYDENGALVSGGTAIAGAAVSSPFTLPDSGFGAPQLLMLLAAAFLVLAVFGPPFLVRRLRASRRPRP